MIGLITLQSKHAVAKLAVLIGGLCGLWWLIQPWQLSYAADGVAAVVNKEIITDYDLDQRLLLAAFATGQKLDERTRTDLTPQILQVMIDESLKLQAANKAKITVSDEEVSAEIADVEARNKLKSGALLPMLKGQHIDESALSNQLRAQIAWQKYVNSRLGRELRISDDEIDSAIAEYVANMSKPQARLQEIVLSNDNKDSKTLIGQIYGQLQKGADFGNLARNFSQSASASKGGDLGWVIQADLDPAIEQVVAKMRAGDISTPINGLGGITIIRLIESRQGSADPNNAKLNLRLVTILDQTATAKSTKPPKQISDAITTVSAGDELCPKLDGLVDNLRKIGWSANISEVKDTKINELRSDWQSQVRFLSAGQYSPPIAQTGQWQIIAVCSRNESGVTPPNRDEIFQQIAINRGSILERRLIRDLRRSAFIEIRR